MNKASKILSDITVHMKYAKFLPKKRRRETYEELVTRNKKMHIKKYPELSTLTSGKRLMIRGDKIKQIKSILKGKEDNDLYDRMVSLRTARKKREKAPPVPKKRVVVKNNYSTTCSHSEKIYKNKGTEKIKTC